VTASLHQLTCLTSARFRARAPGPVSGQSCSTPGRRTGTAALVSCCLSAAGVRFLGILSRPGLVPLSRSAYRTATVSGADPRGFSMFRTRETRPGAGALSTPGTAVPATARGHPWPPRAAFQRPVPILPVLHSVPGSGDDEASARVHWRSPFPAFPSPVAPGRYGDPRALPWAPHPAGQDPAAHARAGTGLRHYPELRHQHPRSPSTRSLTTCDLMSHCPFTLWSGFPGLQIGRTLPRRLLRALRRHRTRVP
jgi:hypothetical protein